MHVRREHLRLMDQHLIGSRTPPPFPQKEATFTLEQEWADMRLQPCPLMVMGFTGKQILKYIKFFLKT